MKKKNIKKWIAIGIPSIIVILLTIGFIKINTIPQLKLLVATFKLSESTLTDPGYLAYNVDLMDLFQNYFNGDSSFEGTVSLHAKSIGFSSSMDITGERSMSQRKFSMSSDMALLWVNVGEMTVSGSDHMLYISVPMLDNMKVVFDTENDLFKKAPQLTSDIDQEWFRANMSNISELIDHITIEDQGKIYENPETQDMCSQFIVTIPVGYGDFIWELLGIDAPDHDIVSTICIDKGFNIVCMELNLDDVMEGAKIVIDGKHLGHCAISYKLPFNEAFELSFTRNPDIKYTNFLYMDAKYTTSAKKELTSSMYVTILQHPDHMDLDISEVKSSQGHNTLATGTFHGTITKVDKLPYVFRNVDMDYSDVEINYWSAIRTNLESFTKDLIAEAKSRL